MNYRGTAADGTPVVDERHDAMRETLCVRGSRFASAGVPC